MVLERINPDSQPISRLGQNPSCAKMPRRQKLCLDVKLAPPKKSIVITRWWWRWSTEEGRTLKLWGMQKLSADSTAFEVG